MTDSHEAGEGAELLRQEQADYDMRRQEYEAKRKDDALVGEALREAPLTEIDYAALALLTSGDQYQAFRYVLAEIAKLRRL